jgi:hypothetical protein
MKVVSSSIVLVSDCGFSCINVSTSEKKKSHFGFFNFHLCVEGVGSVLVVSRDISIGKWSLLYISLGTDPRIFSVQAIK